MPCHSGLPESCRLLSRVGDGCHFRVEPPVAERPAERRAPGRWAAFCSPVRRRLHDRWPVLRLSDRQLPLRRRRVELHRLPGGAPRDRRLRDLRRWSDVLQLHLRHRHLFGAFRLRQPPWQQLRVRLEHVDLRCLPGKPTDGGSHLWQHGLRVSIWRRHVPVLEIVVVVRDADVRDRSGPEPVGKGVQRHHRTLRVPVSRLRPDLRLWRRARAAMLVPGRASGQRNPVRRVRLRLVRLRRSALLLLRQCPFSESVELHRPATARLPGDSTRQRGVLLDAGG